MQDPLHDNPELAADVDRDRAPTIAGALDDLNEATGAMAANYAEAVKSRDWLREQNSGLRSRVMALPDQKEQLRSQVIALENELDHADAHGPAEPAYRAGDLI